MSEDYAEKNSFTGICHFTDDGIPGTAFEREGLQAMPAEVEKGNIGTIIEDRQTGNHGIITVRDNYELTDTTKRRKAAGRDHSIRAKLAKAKEQAKQPAHTALRGQDEVSKTYFFPKSYVSYRKPEAVSAGQRERAR